MANAEKLLRALLAKAYKKQDTEIEEILSDKTDDNAGEAAVIGWDTTRVSEIKTPVPGTTFQDGYKKAKAEVLTQVETELKAKHNFEGDLKGIELIEAIISQQQGGKGSKLSDEEVRKHPIFLQFEKDMRKQLKEKETELTTKISELENGFKKDQIFNEVSQNALKELEKLNPVLPGNPTVADTWRKNFLNEFKGFEFQKQADGKFLVLKDGQVVQNAHGHSQFLEDLVKNTAPQFFEFKQNNGGANPGGEGQQGGGTNTGGVNYPAGIPKPTNETELFKVLNDTSIKAEDRQTVLQTWEKETAGQK